MSGQSLTAAGLIEQELKRDSRPQTIWGKPLSDLLQSAAEHQAETVAAVYAGSRWVAFRGRLISMGEGQLIFRFPSPQPADPRETMAGQTSQIVIKFRDYRYLGSLCLSTLVRDGPMADCLCGSPPKEMKKFDRRLHRRIDVPPGTDVRVHIHPADSQLPAWAGRVVNLSSEGLQVRVSGSVTSFFQPGDVARLTVHLSADGESFTTFAHFRNGTPDGDMALVGFEFSETGTPGDSLKMLDTILLHLR